MFRALFFCLASAFCVAESVDYVCQYPTQRENGDALALSEIAGVEVRAAINGNAYTVDDTDGVCAGTFDNLPRGYADFDARAYDTNSPPAYSRWSTQISGVQIGPNLGKPTVSAVKNEVAVTKIFEDFFIEESDTALGSHTPDAGTSWNVHGGGALNVISSTGKLQESGQLVTSRANTNDLSETEYDVVAKFDDSGRKTTGAIGWGVTGRNTANNVFDGVKFLFLNGTLELEVSGGGYTSTAFTYPGDPTWLKLEVRDNSLKGYTSTDGSAWTEQLSLAENPNSTTGTFAGLEIYDYASGEPAQVHEFYVDDLTVPATPVSSDSELQWDLLNSVNQDGSFAWSVLNEVSSDSTLQWALLNAINSDSALKWSILQSIENNAELRWSIQAALSSVFSDSDLRWQILNSAEQSVDVRWNILSSVLSDSEHRWSILSGVMADANFQWDLLATVSGDADLQWDILSALSSVNADVGLQWSIVSAVQQSLTAQWGIFNDVTSDADLRWQLLAAITSDLSAQWEVVEAIQSGAELQWSIIGKTESDLTLRWSIQSTNQFPELDGTITLQSNTPTISFASLTPKITLH